MLSGKEYVYDINIGVPSQLYYISSTCIVVQTQRSINAGADSGITSGGWEILERENYTKGKKGRLSIKTTFLK